jgi:excinuclease ABC subunit A
MSSQELIIEGARQNNLRNITLRIPHSKVIAVIGVPGSGKSSLKMNHDFPIPLKLHGESAGAA